jgi:hypothetical protein
MKLKLSHFLFLLILLQACNGPKIATRHTPNFIDSLQTATQIEDLLAKINDKYKLKPFKVNPNLTFSAQECQKIADSLHLKSWQKADFDQNGFTDLLVIGENADNSVLSILDKGNHQYEIKPFPTKGAFSNYCPLPLVNTSNELGLIDYYLSKPRPPSEAQKLEKVSLVYKYGTFIEFNPKPTHHLIEKIEYSTGACFGSCPVFELTLKSDLSATWHANYYNKINDKEVKGNFKATLQPNLYSEIVNLLNYLDFERLNDHYAVNWTDDQSCVLKITYDNGKIKSINDYGLQGTFGLGHFYERMFELRKNLQWKP